MAEPQGLGDWVAAAETLLAAGDWAAAEACCLSAAAAFPDAVAWRFPLGLARLRRRGPEAALNDVAAGLLAVPHDGARNRAAAECLLRLPDRRAALAAAVDLLAQAPWNLFILEPLGALLRLGRDRARVHVVGDSHALHLFTCMPDAAVHWLGPMTMRRVGREPVDLKRLGAGPGDQAIFVFGEIDCRCHVDRVAGGGDPEASLRELVERYRRSIIRSLEQAGVTAAAVCGPAPALSPDVTMDEAAAGGFPLAGPPERRRAIARRMNDMLRDVCAAAGWGFLDLHGLYADAAGFLRVEDSDGLVHVRYDRIAPAARILGLTAAIPFGAGWAAWEQQWERRKVDRYETARALLAASAWEGLLAETERLLADGGADAAALFLRARALGKLGRRDQSLAAATAALALDPAHVDSLSQRGNVLYQQGELAAAAACFGRAWRLTPEDPGVASWLAIVAFEMGDYATARAPAVVSHNLISTPAFRFAQIAQFCEVLDPDGSDEKVGAAAARVTQRAQEIGADVLPARPAAGRRLRVGAYCSFFHVQSGDRFILPQLAALDADRFELLLIGGDFDKARVDGFAVAPSSGFGLGRESLVNALRRLELDVLIDFDGPAPMYDVWARRVAPVQLAAYNYPFQTGLPTMDGFVTEALIVPPGSDRFFTERVLRLSSPAYAFRIPDAWRRPSPSPFLRNGWVTFGFFGNPVKLNQPLLARWGEVMRATPGSRLLLGHGVYHQGSMPAAWRRRLRAAGIPDDRSELLPGVAADMVHERYQQIDIALDPYPYNGGHTTMEALCFGAPTVSLSGDRLISRHGEAFLTHVGLPELVARTPEEYVAKLAALAEDVDRLAALRRDLPERVANSPLCDLASVGRAWGEVIETAFAAAAG